MHSRASGYDRRVDALEPWRRSALLGRRDGAVHLPARPRHAPSHPLVDAGGGRLDRLPPRWRPGGRPAPRPPRPCHPAAPPPARLPRRRGGGRAGAEPRDARPFEPLGELYRLSPDGRCDVVDQGFIIVNGIAWSPDNRTMYVADTRRDIVYAYDFDISTGSAAGRRPWISTKNIPGRVDGGTMARDGTYWCAHVRGGEIAQYDPAGHLMRTVPLPVRYPLMCSFGGPDMDILFATTRPVLATPAHSPAHPPTRSPPPPPRERQPVCRSWHGQHRHSGR